MQAGETLEIPGGQISARAVTSDDTGFLLGVYASTREEELARVPWSAEEKRRFVAHQFAAQDHAYRHNYPGADWLIVRLDGRDAGRLYLHRREDEIRIMDLALLPAFRSRGIGSAVLRAIMRRGAAEKRRVTIHVEVFNPARRLYERLGFTPVGGTEVYALLEWRPSP